MKLLGLVWANLFRKKTRTLLTLLSLISAFLLFGLLQAVSNAFSAGADFVGASRLVTQARVSFTQSLPMRQLRQIEGVPGVAAVSFQQWFGGIYQDPKNFFPQFAVDPDRLFTVYPEWKLTEAEKQTFRTVKASAIVGSQLAKKFGWKVGDQVPLESTIWPTQDGNKTWTFEVAGIFGGVDADWESRANLMYLNFAYFDEERQFGRGAAGTYSIKLKDSKQAAIVAAAIDAMFENSPDETKTQTEKDFNIGFFKQIGDIGLLVNYVLFAVFFTILLVVGNTMAQSVRERIPELAVLKTLGFNDFTVLMMVLSESLLICLLGALIGMGFAAVILKAASVAIQLPLSSGNTKLWLQAVATAFALSIAVGVLPAWRARTLKIVDALAGR
jgi:putative ABC transport system permease protein